MFRARVESNQIELDENRAEETSCVQIGQVLADRYEIVRKIGEGGMGEVYEARHRVLGRRFAVKILHPELVRSGRMLRRFSREALSASCLESDHVIGITDCGQLPDGTPFYVMDYLRGCDLRQLLNASGVLAPQRVVQLALDVCHGLRAAHESELVHRDLKPENVFVESLDDGGERAKVLDFGVVQLGTGNSTARAGALVGTLKYMAPEQARGDANVDARADLYALGVILYECIAGRVPHPGQNPEEILFHVLNGEVPPLSARAQGLPPGLDALVMRAIERNPALRFQTVGELAQALASVARTNPMPQFARNVEATIGETLSESVSGAQRTPIARARYLSLGGSARWPHRLGWVLLGMAVGGLGIAAGGLVKWKTLALPVATPSVTSKAALVASTAAAQAPAPQPTASTDETSSAGRARPSSQRYEAAPRLSATAALVRARVEPTAPVQADDHDVRFDSQNPYLTSSPPLNK